MKSLSDCLTKTTLATLMSAIVLSGALSSQVKAQEISGVEVAEQIVINDSQLQLNGAGVRSKFFFDLYVGSLYLTAPSADLASVISSDESAVRLNITSGMITSDKMRDAIIDGFDDATDGNTTDIQAQIDAFMALFSDEIKEGDQFTLLTSKVSGVTAYKNGVPQDTIEGEAFRQALLKIWLGDSPAQTSLKKDMLGK
ncbi:chalcone isomerase family protein [Shewanella sp.]|uniref:chalcone isomerase family protein n=1 Tax=Shewanella sp. TaxID=50422 RepID=UPI0025908483|nr:chalcone isomerase family protein [Shewanella sp.]MCJ8302345.1 chalcone isomerase family protein [Shewanella sp.]